MKKIIKLIYLDGVRFLVFRILFFLTNNLRRKGFEPAGVSKIIIIGQNHIGDNVLSIPVLRAVRSHFKNAKITIISNRYVKDILIVDGSVDEILFFRNENIFRKLTFLFAKLRGRWDLGIDLTCDYSFLPAFLLFVSGARFRIGYNSKERGFLFHRAVQWLEERKHFADRLADILKVINIEVPDIRARLKVSEEVKKNAKSILYSRGISEDDFVIGFHPGGYFPSQRWPVEKFAEVADSLINKYRAKIIVLAGAKEKMLMDSMVSLMHGKPTEIYGFSIPDLLGLIINCKIIICNNSGLLHLAAALDVPTVSTMGPTDETMWWPQGENNIVLKKDLSCLGCGRSSCRKHDCMDLITVSDMLEAVDSLIKKISNKINI